jgi:hypothetical protein
MSMDKSGNPVLTDNAIAYFFSHIFHNLTGRWHTAVCKLIDKVNYFIFLGVGQAFDRFRVEFADRHLGAIESSTQRCPIDLVLFCCAQKIWLGLFTQISQRLGYSSVVGLIRHD